MKIRHFLTLSDLNQDELIRIIDMATLLKVKLRSGTAKQTLKHKILAMIFEKSSTRTRVSFETAMAQEGGHAIFLSPADTQLGRGEPIEDTSRVLSEMVDIIMIRTYDHAMLQRFSDHATVPVINGLTDTYHPCQLLADIMTYVENRGSMKGKTVAWLGDGNNMCHSYINAARILEFKLNISCPDGYMPEQAIIDSSPGYIQIIEEPEQAVKNADLVVTDVWASMGQESESEERKKIFAPYQVNSALMALAARDALFMHCLPAHRGEEVTAEVIEGAQSVVWQEAGNRLHAQKALLQFLLLSEQID